MANYDKDELQLLKPISQEELRQPLGFNAVDTNSFRSVLEKMIQRLDPDMTITVHKSQDNFDYVIKAYKEVRSKQYEASCHVGIQEMVAVSNFQEFIFEQGIKKLHRSLDVEIQKDLAPKITVISEIIEDEMARKIRIAKTPQRHIDPKRIKKPFCPIHKETQMEYDQVRGKWVCKVDSCNQVATPKAAPEDNAVTFGKGKVQMRLMYTDDGNPHVILIADNNVALEVTDMFDISEIEDAFGVKETIELANSNARKEFHIPTAQQVAFRSSLYVMGTDNIK